MIMYRYLKVYFPNAKSAEFQYVTVPNLLLSIKPFGKILYMLRLVIFTNRIFVRFNFISTRNHSRICTANHLIIPSVIVSPSEEEQH